MVWPCLSQLWDKHLLPTNSAATNITAICATLNGTINRQLFIYCVSFDYGITTSYGKTITAIQSPITGGTNTNVSADIYRH